MRWRRTTRSACARPWAVRIASLCSPRSTRPSASRRFSISPAEARRRPACPRRARRGWEPFVSGTVLPNGESQEIDRLEVVVDRVSRRHLRDDPTGAPLRLGLPARDRARSRAAVHVPRGRGGEGLGRLRSVRRRTAAGSSSGSRTRLRRRSSRSPSSGSRSCRPALVDLALWLPTTTARRRRARSPSSPLRRGRGVGARSAARGPKAPAEEAPARLTDEQEQRWSGSSARWGAAAPSSSTARREAARPRSTCGPARRRSRGLGAIVLVPEIALTPQALGRFTARFPGQVAVLHSGMTDAERRDERERIASGEAASSSAPARPSSRRWRGSASSASTRSTMPPTSRSPTRATTRAPSPRSAPPRGRGGRVRERDAPPGELGAARAARARRPPRRRLPHVQVVDLRREAGYPLSAPLLEELGAISDGGGKAILLLNRRGIAPALHCRACGATFAARAATWRSRCTGTARSTATTAERGAEPDALPGLRAPSSPLGAGTERLEQELAERLPGLELIRLDADVASNPAELAERLARFAEADRAVLLGTQMVAKGHHFEGVALAAVVDADTGMALPDFRAEERTFQLVTQLAGTKRPRRAGTRARPDLPAGLAPDRARGAPRGGRVPRRRTRAPPRARLSALPPPRPDRRLGPGADGPSALLTELRRTSKALTETCSARPRSSACGTGTGLSSRQDGESAPGRCAAARLLGCGGSGDAAGRPDGLRRRRSAGSLA